ncbi:MAG: NAD-dependent epimerase/dehydratase family protein [Steroidobacteraceae bacterium]
MPVAWITGARGFIGRHLAHHLNGQGLTVCGIGHGHLPADAWPEAGLAQWSNSEITGEALAHLATEQGVPSWVFHLAGGSAVGASLHAPLEDFNRTTGTTARLLEWLRVHSPASKLIVASSAAVYGDTAGAPAEESRAAAPVSPYGYHKFMMEQLCREYSRVFGLETCVLRMFSVYGEGLRKQLLWDCSVKLTAQTRSIELGGSGEELRDWIHIDDAVAMIRRASELASIDSPILNGGSGRAVRVRDVVMLLSSALSSTARVNFSGIRRPGDPAALIADTRRMTAAGGTCRVSIEAGVRRYADWFRLARIER